METRLVSREIELLKKDFGISNSVFMDCDCSGNGRKGGLCPQWTDYLQVDLTSF